jgi:hypothetical protein
MSENSIIKSFDYKWYQFLIIYGIINLFFFFCFFNLGVELHEDEGAVEEFFMLAFQMVFLIITIGILVILEFVSILIFRIAYFRSEVEAEEKVQLSHYIRNAVWFFLLAYFICIFLFGEIRDVFFYVLMYLPVPSFTLLLIYLKLISNKDGSTKRKTNWGTILIYLFIIFGISIFINFLMSLYALMTN